MTKTCTTYATIWSRRLMSGIREEPKTASKRPSSGNASYELKFMDSIYWDWKGDAVYDNDDMSFVLKNSTSSRRYDHDRKNSGRAIRRKGQKEAWRKTKRNDTGTTSRTRHFHRKKKCDFFLHIFSKPAPVPGSDRQKKCDFFLHIFSKPAPVPGSDRKKKVRFFLHTFSKPAPVPGSDSKKKCYFCSPHFQ